MNCDRRNSQENTIGKLFLKASLFMWSNISRAASSGSIRKGIEKSFFSVSRVRMKPGLAT